MARRRDKGAEKRLAAERIARLLRLAHDEAVAGRHATADRYTVLVGRIARRYQTGLPDEAKVRVCRACAHHLHPGATSRTRLRNGKVCTTCLHCGHVRRRPVATRPTHKETET